jgi:hypothetical protein
VQRGASTINLSRISVSLCSLAFVAALATGSSTVTGGSPSTDLGATGNDPTTDDNDGTFTDDGDLPRGDGGLQSSGSHPNCDAYLKCVAAATPKDSADAKDVYGPSGTCWTTQGTATCETRCQTLTSGIHTNQPGIAACGVATVTECLQCITDSDLYDDCATSGCKAIEPVSTRAPRRHVSPAA